MRHEEVVEQAERDITKILKDVEEIIGLRVISVDVLEIDATQVQHRNPQVGRRIRIQIERPVGKFWM